jgi:hypothetical protein
MGVITAKEKFMRTTTRIAGAVAGVALALGSLGSVSASAEKPEPCAQQQKQVDRAEDALARVTLVFQRQQTKVKKAKHEVRVADTARERAHAKRDLAHAKAKRDHVKKAKTAQQQRLAKAEARLDACEAKQPTS